MTTTPSFGSELRRLREAAGLSQAELARRVNYSKGHLCHVESGAKRPSPELAQACDQALGAGGALSRAAGPGEADAPRLTAPGPAVDLLGYPMESVLAAGTATISGWSLVPAPDRSGGLSDAVASFERTFAELRGLGQQVDAGIVGQMLIAAVGTLVGLSNRTRGGAQAEVLRLASRYAELAGWMAQEKNDDAAARWWTNTAVGLAETGGDHELRSYALVRHAELALYDDDPATAVALAQQVQRDNCGPRIRGFAALREAQGHALAHNERDSLAALDRARDLMARAAAVESAGPPLGSVNMTDPIAFATGWCLHELGLGQRAGEVMASQLDGLPPSAHRTHARYHARLALSLAASGDVERACVAADKAIARVGVVDSATIRHDLKRLRPALARWRTHPAVGDLMPRLIDSLRTNTNGYI